MADIKLRDNKGVERVYEGVEAVTVPSANGGVAVEFNHAADWIVDEGTSGIWTYRKWNSGMSECWAKITRSLSYTALWVNGLYNATIQSISYPTGLFVAAPLSFIIASSTHGSLFIRQDEQISETGLIVLAKSTQGSIDTTVSMHMIGRWK